METGRRDINVGALVLIGLGIILLLGQLGMQLSFNWWAIFIALPGLAMLRNVYNAYSAGSRLGNNDLMQGGLGLFLVVLALAFALRIGWGRRFPAVAVAMLAAFALAVSPWTVSRFFLPGHSMIAARAAGGLLVVMLGWWAANRACLRLNVALLAGLLAGWGWFFSNDQGPGTTLGLWVVMAARLRALDGAATPWWKTFVDLTLSSALMAATCAAAYLALVSAATLGHPGPLLEYYFRTIPANQIWWFGGPPSRFAERWQDLAFFPALWVPCLLWLAAGMAVCRRRRMPGGATDALAPLFGGWFACGALASLPVLGMLLPHYSAGLVQGVALAAAVLTGRRWRARVPDEPARAHGMAWVAAATVAVLSAITLYFIWEWRRAHLPGRGCDDAAQLARVVATTPPGPTPVWSLYRGLAEEAMDIPRPTRWDYVIHALGAEAQRSYDEAFARCAPAVVRTIRAERFRFHGWLWHTRWGFFGPLLQAFRPAAAGQIYVDWTRRPQPLAWKRQPLPVEVTHDPSGAWRWSIDLPPGSPRGTLVEVRLAIVQPGGDIGDGLHRKLTRIVVSHPRGALDGDAFAIPPEDVAGGRFTWCLIGDGAPTIAGALDLRGPLSRPATEVTALEADALGVLEPDVVRVLAPGVPAQEWHQIRKAR